MAVLKPRVRWLLVATALFLLVVSSIVSTIFFDNSKEGSQGQRLHSQHAILGAKPEDVLFVGDDLVAEGLWTELLPDRNVRNRGLNGQTTSELIRRIVPLVSAKPRQLYLSIGANDLANQVEVAVIMANYRELINLIKAFSPDTRIVVMTALPLTPQSYPGIESLNEELKVLAETHTLDFVDTASALLSQTGEYRPGLADRRMRLLGDGYALWRELLQQHLEDI
ncbi:MAG: GDSL-type esterase/lipase family protein [Pseudomonadales bacterium]